MRNAAPKKQGMFRWLSQQRTLTEKGLVAAALAGAAAGTVLHLLASGTFGWGDVVWVAVAAIFALASYIHRHDQITCGVSAMWATGAFAIALIGPSLYLIGGLAMFTMAYYLVVVVRDSHRPPR